MNNFDIKTLIGLKPPTCMCPRCLGLFKDPGIFSTREDFQYYYGCPACGANFLQEEGGPTFDKYLTNNHCKIAYKDITGQCKRLATLANGFQSKRMDPMSTLLSSMLAAENFIHFTSMGISEFFIGALRLASLRVSVRGVVSEGKERTIQELVEHDDEAGNFEVRVYGPKHEWEEKPHQKFVVIDGLMAFKGSANLSTIAWRKARKNLEVIEAATTIEEVITLHNEYFSPHWAALGNLGTEILMEEDYPW